MPNPFAPRNFSLRNVQCKCLSELSSNASRERILTDPCAASKPQVYQTEPRLSVAASDDYYYSLSDQSSPTESQETVRRFESAPSHQSSEASLPVVSETNQAVEVGESSRRHRRVPTDTSHGTARPGTASTLRFGGNRVSQISPESDDTPPPVLREYAGTAPTPGVDDSPYVRFAIDQLTRDEEVSGSMQQGSVSSRDDYPVDRLVWDEGLGYFTRTRTPIRHDHTPPKPSHTSPQTLSERVDSVDPESFVPVDPPEQSLLYPSLNYRPIPLRPVALAVTILCCLLMIAGVVFCNVCSQRHGLWDYDGQGSARYFVMQFLPQILAASIMVCTFVIQAAVYRIAPFAIMSEERQLDHVLGGLPILSRNFLVPDFSHFRHGETLVGFCLFSIWLSNVFSLPLLSCLFQVKYYYSDVMTGQGVWKWASVEAVGWTLVASYGLSVIGLLLLLARFLWGSTGLMWDPTSLADVVSIIQRSNILHGYEQTEIAPSVGKLLEPRVLRLGYWKLSCKPQIFYGIAEVDAPVRSPSLHQTEKSRKKQPHGLAEVCFDVEQHGDNTSFDHQLYSPLTRYRWTPWFLRTTAVCIWTVIVFALFIALVVVSFLHHAIQGGFLPKLPTLPSASAFSSSNFLYSFIPALIGNALFLLWQPIDVSFRALQPFAELSSPNGTTAEKSILLSYPASLPIQTTIQALLNQHWKVAWISLMSLVFAAIPILSGGIFQSLYWASHQEIRITPMMPAFYALVIFSGLYAVSFLAIWPRRCRHLPHDISTIADLISFLYQSPLLADKLLREPRSKTDLVTRLILAAPGEREFPLYGFGIFVGRDGREHLGIDRFRRPGRTDMLITTGF